MTAQSRAPTSKLLDLIRTGGTSQERRDAANTEKDLGKAPKERAQVSSITSKGPVVQIDKRDSIAISSGFYKVPNIVDDYIVGGLSMSEEVVYRHMIRMSWGWNRNWCRVGTSYFLQRSSLKSRKAVKDAVARLLAKGLLQYHIVKGQIDRNQDGTVYIVPLPEEIGILPNSVPHNSTLPNSIPDNGSENADLRHGVLEYSTLLNSVLSDSTVNNSIPGVSPDSVLANNTPDRKPRNTRIDGGILQDSILQDNRITDNTTDRSKNTLSIEQVITLFYEGVGQKRLSRQKRERAESCIKELMKDNFSLEDIYFAVAWTLENAKEKPYDFSIIKYTIGQAMAEEQKIEDRKSRQLEQERVAVEEQAEERKKAKEVARIKAYKDELSDEEKAELRKRAETEIKKAGEFKEEFITPHLIAAKENEIIGKHLGIKLS